MFIIRIFETDWEMGEIDKVLFCILKVRPYQPLEMEECLSKRVGQQTLSPKRKEAGYHLEIKER